MNIEKVRRRYISEGRISNEDFFELLAEVERYRTEYNVNEVEIGMHMMKKEVADLRIEIAELKQRIENWRDDYGNMEKDYKEKITDLRRALEQIAMGEGRYSRDRLTHASNTIKDMKAIANKALGEKQAE